MAKYLKSYDEILKDMDDVISKMTLYDLVKYSDLPFAFDYNNSNEFSISYVSTNKSVGNHKYISKELDSKGSNDNILIDYDNNVLKSA
ncbi:hypothetical protein DS831_06130 [Bombilactobacillus bombi]|uniref:Uncharacterized protein n=1 Tax=Bombilactobacillus bombi TaxID=1303590 RepID=A0A417ZEQ3_9LACO|nr:hypothetical protein [Bombilactobacillus bombi]RHW49738.1 hypothetical protein DS831_06130 [Bombilactobacillus bombi]